MAAHIDRQVTRTIKTTVTIDDLELMRMIRASVDIQIPDCVSMHMDPDNQEITLWWNTVTQD